MKKLFILLTLVISTGCNLNHFTLYNSDRTNGLDFQEGKWLIGNIEINPFYKDKLTELVYTNFNSRLSERVKLVSQEKSLLIPVKIDLNPSKEELKKLKIGTNYDYFVNVKCKSNRNDISNFKLIEHDYYLKQMSFAEITLEVYDLKLEKIVYTQTARGNIDEHMSATSRPIYNVIMGCYKKIWEDIASKSIH